MFEKEIAEAETKLSGKTIGVVMGGFSSEREISLSSGNAIAEVLEEANYSVKRVVIDKKDLKIKELEACDVLFIALHGVGGEDGAIQGVLDWLGKPYTGSGVLGNALSLNKYLTKQMIKEVEIPTPAYKLNDRGSMKAPLVIKATSEGSTIGLEICETEEEVEDALKKLSHYEELMFEEFIEGRQLTVGVILNEPLDIIEIKPHGGFYDFKHKYTKGLTDYVCPAEVSVRIEKLIKEYALTAHKVCHCEGMSRSDFILDKNNVPYFLEINTIPGFTATSLLPKAAKSKGIDFLNLIKVLLLNALLKENK